MTKTISANTLKALQSARRSSLVVRDFVSIWGRDRETGEDAFIGFWNGAHPVTCPVVDPANGATDVRTFQAQGGLLNIPAIPSSLKLEVATIKLHFSHLSEAVQLAIRGYDPKMAKCRSIAASSIL